MAGGVLTRAQVHEIYLAKCEELNVPPCDESERVNAKQLASAFCRKSMRLPGFGIGSLAMRKLVDAIQYKVAPYVLDLSMNRLGDAGAQLVAEVLEHWPVIHLDLRSNAITPDGWKYIFDALSRNDTVTYLDTGAVGGRDRNRLGTDGLHALAYVVTKNGVLSHLNLAMSAVSVEACKVLGAAVVDSGSLIRLDLSCNSIGDRGVAKLCEFAKLEPVEELVLSRNQITDAGARALCGAVRCTRTLRVLDVSKNQLGRVFLRALLDAQAVDPWLAELDMSGCGLTSQCSSILLELLRGLTTLKVLNLSQNALGDGVVVGLLAETYGLEREPPQLQRLGLAETRIGNGAAQILADYLAHDPPLISLDLSDNSIGDEGGKLLAGALVRRTHLRELNLRGNDLVNSGLAFTRVLSTNGWLTVSLGLNDFTPQVHHEVVSAVREHAARSLTRSRDRVKVKIAALKEAVGELDRARDETAAANALRLEREERLRELQDKLAKLTEERSARIADERATVEDLTAQVEEVVNAKATKSFALSQARMEADEAKGRLHQELERLAAKKAQAQGRLRRAEAAMTALDIEEQQVRDLEAQFEAVQSDIRTMLAAARAEKERWEEEQRILNERAEGTRTKKKGKMKTARPKTGRRKKKRKAAGPSTAPIGATNVSTTELRLDL